MDSQLIETIPEATDVSLNRLNALWLKIDNFQHRVHRGLLRRWDNKIAQTGEGWLSRTLEARLRQCGCAVLSQDPPVLFVPIEGGQRPLWMLQGLSSFLGHRPAVILLVPYWCCEQPTRVEFIRRNAEHHRQRFPKHSLVFLCNTTEEERLLGAAGLTTVFANQNQIVSEHVFRPQPSQAVRFDAVYNAKITRFKRHYLAQAIERVLYVAYRCPIDMSRSAGRAYVQRMLARSPGHRFANALVRGLPTPLTPEQVNDAYNQAAVGLCLSPVEGAMYSSMEYLLAGLPVVTTPSQGGRDVFFDPEFCITADPDPRRIRDAVIALRDRAIPREVIRKRTLDRVEAARQHSLAQIADVLARHGTGFDARKVWPPIGCIPPYKPVGAHGARLRARSTIA